MGPSGRQATKGIVVAVLSAAALVLVIAIFVQSPAGQRIDETAYLGARIGRWRIADTAFRILGLVTVAGMIAASAAAVVIAASRRRVDLALGTLVLVGGANVTTQVLKQGLLDRPDLGIETSTLNSLPSGHTTVVASLAVALLLVVPPRLRAPVAVLGALITALTGVATLIVGWHRPSDVVAAVLVVSAWSGLVVAGLAMVAKGSTGPAAGRRVAELILLVAGVVLLGASAVGLVQTAVFPAIPTDRSNLALAYLGGACGIAGCATLMIVVVLELIATGGTVDAAISPASGSWPIPVPRGRPAD